MLSHSIRIAAGHLANEHATPGAFAYVDMVVARRSRSDEIKRWVCVQEIRIDSRGNVDAENFRVGLDLSYSRKKPQIMLRERSLKEISLRLLRLGEVYPHGERASTPGPVTLIPLQIPSVACVRNGINVPVLAVLNVPHENPSCKRFTDGMNRSDHAKVCPSPLRQQSVFWASLTEP
jgi:hypothetical protein